MAGLGSVRATLMQTSPAVRGALWMVLVSTCWAGMSGLIRYISFELHPFEVAFFRTAFVVVFMAPWLLRARGGGFPRNDRRVFLFRPFIHVVAMMTWFLAVSLMPLAEATALYFTAPFFATILAIMFLGEVVRARRWAAIAIGFAGALVVLRPGLQGFSLAAALVLTSAIFSAGSRITVRFLTHRTDPNAIVTWHFILLTPLTFIPAVFVWEWPEAHTYPWLAALAGLGTVGHLALTRAYALAEASQLAPLDFTQLLAVAAIGFLAFSEVPDIWTWVGGAVIAGSAVYMARREALVRRADAAGGG